jgi:hypothetical protein
MSPAFRLVGLRYNHPDRFAGFHSAFSEGTAKCGVPKKMIATALLIALPFSPFQGLQIPLFDELAFHRIQAVEQNQPVKVIDFVLKRPSQQTVGLDLGFLCPRGPGRAP